jgi:hypothetical protein
MMKECTQMKRIASAMTTVVFVVTVGLSGAAFHDGPHVGPDGEVFNVGKKGDVKIGLDVAIGDVLVKKGKYLFEHRMEGDRHMLVLTGLETKNGIEAPVHQIPMRFITSKDAVKKSALFAERLRDRSYRVSVIQIAGESGDHMPAAAGSI